jgi:16S rRNA (guanine966-N2)-methyltransferase
MRIIGGKLKGLRLHPPTSLPVRPTTDLAKEALFNILNNLIDLETVRVLDLFSGTGSMSVEFASRGAVKVESVDKDFHCCKFLKTTAEKLELSSIHVNRADVFKFLDHETETYNIIFVDPPYDHPGLPAIPGIVFNNNLLADDGLLILEHPSMKKVDHPRFTEQRKYGHSSFSFYR